jgi:hypothetical protein
MLVTAQNRLQLVGETSSTCNCCNQLVQEYLSALAQVQAFEMMQKHYLTFAAKTFHSQLKSSTQDLSKKSPHFHSLCVCVCSFLL